MSTDTRQAPAPHTVALTHSREVLFDRVPEGWRVVFYWPKADKATLRRLAAGANRGDADAVRRLRDLPRNRSGATHPSFRQALLNAIHVYDAQRAPALVEEIVRFAAYVGWYEQRDEPVSAGGQGQLPEDF